MVKVEAGKFYKTRSGEKKGPMARKRGGWISEIECVDESDPFDWYDDGTYSYYVDESDVDLTHDLDLIEEWHDEPEITIGSLWSYNNDPSFVVKIIAISDNGQKVCEVVEGVDDVSGEGAGSCFVYNEETISFDTLYTPYVEKRKLVGYVAVMEQNGSLFFGTAFSNEKSAREIAELCRYDILDVIKVEWKER